jgi:hypothetical protein
MTTPRRNAAQEAFLGRLEAVVSDMALLYAGGAEELVERSLAQIGARVKAEWSDIAKEAGISDVNADSAVDDLLRRIRARRQAIESRGVGRA